MNDDDQLLRIKRRPSSRERIARVKGIAICDRDNVDPFQLKSLKSIRYFKNKLKKKALHIYLSRAIPIVGLASCGGHTQQFPMPDD